ncbi:MAG: alpha-galactosidase [Chloroflexota bacterium]
MPIHWSSDAREFHLLNEHISYVMRVNEDGSLGHLYFGSALVADRLAHVEPGGFAGFDNRVGEPVAFEYPTSGGGDYRIPGLSVEHADGSTVLRLAYVEHRIVAGKPESPETGLPATYVEGDDEADTLVVTVADAISGLVVELSYTLFRDRPVVARSARIRNDGPTVAKIRTAMSGSLDLPDARWDFVQLSGAWARENHVIATPLRPGRISVGSDRGSSSHQHNPFIALVRTTTTEDAGEAYGVSLVYSGNFIAEAEVDPYDTTRVRIGISPATFTWTLEPGDSFQTPEAILVHSSTGLGTMSDALHRLYRDRLARGTWRDRPRPVLLNNWEATYFGFDEAKLVEIATSARDLGVELFVLDDGWFGQRDWEDSSLGDWFVDRRKLPAGLDGVASKVEALGIRFGLWIEPEMISERSRLFEAHPDWAIGIPGRPRTESRQQFVIDMSRPEIVDHLFGVLSDVLASASISYIKWDFNRTITEPYSVGLPADRQGEFFHRYVLGTYDLYRRLTAAFPDVLFESCAGGGGRFDPGMLAFAPQAWTSDDTDAVERLAIQWGTSLAYPLSSMAAHVAAVPNHQTGRITPIDTRAAVAFFGVFGYELDPTELSEADRAAVATQIAFYKEHREVLQRGRFVRLRSPFEEGERTAWMAIDPSGARAVVGYYQVLNRPVPTADRLRLRGLDPGRRYRVTGWPDAAAEDPLFRDNAGEWGGDELMQIGLSLGADRREAAHWGDFRAWIFVLEAL